MFPQNVPKRSLRMFPECSHEEFYESSIQMLSERSYGRFQESSLWIFSEYCCGTFSQYSFWTFLECSTGTFREHCFATFTKPGNFLSSKNVPMEPSEHSDGTFRTFHGNVQGRYCAMGDVWTQKLVRIATESLVLKITTPKKVCSWYKETYHCSSYFITYYNHKGGWYNLTNPWQLHIVFCVLI